MLVARFQGREQKRSKSWNLSSHLVCGLFWPFLLIKASCRISADSGGSGSVDLCKGGAGHTTHGMNRGWGAGACWQSAYNCLGEGDGSHSSPLAWRIPWTEGPGELLSMGSLRVRHDWVTSLSIFTFMHWRRKWQPTPVSLPGESQGQRSLAGLLSMGSHRVGHDRSDLAAAQLPLFLSLQIQHLIEWMLKQRFLLANYFTQVSYFCMYFITTVMHKTKR